MSCIALAVDKKHKSGCFAIFTQSPRFLQGPSGGHGDARIREGHEATATET
ncbi:uncharacterized protein FMAN_03513 [Fusarium mangiferae]|uniref:Uncharacterized protein n=1 Tax=Fusarium mangiferae TaxID=192010 RepID=A0A1L7TC76_FUSMA|nr:uncharacterized protein FMAN_03513 [Fusarium mangiferae]CVK94392.1 uncharacterized protein FMAN_03513 [Fusarium mangiferae]